MGSDESPSPPVYNTHALWSAVGRRERLWGSGLIYPQKTGIPIDLSENNQSKVLPGDHPLTEQTEDSEYKIAHAE